MIPCSRGEGADSKQDHVGTGHDKAQTSSRTWSALKNPRIVRVSRTFGGKDRHSKVRTIRGLRDRRVRLSVPTAIQLYDLQDKLGLNQPSKVVDWLLSAAQHEIDKLPPLEMLQGSLFDQFPQPNQAASYSGQASFARDDEYTIPSDEAQRLAAPRSGILNNNANVEDTTMLQKSVSNSLDVLMRSKEREAVLAKEMSMERGNNITEGLNNVKHHGFVSENINANTYSPCYHLLETPTSVYSSHGQSEVLPHGYHPIAIVASYMAAASNVGSKQYGHLQVASSASQDVPSDHALRTSLHAAIPNLMVLHKNSTTSSKHHNHDQT